jgi:hypothetical protein
MNVGLGALLLYGVVLAGSTLVAAFADEDSVLVLIPVAVGVGGSLLLPLLADDEIRWVRTIVLAIGNLICCWFSGVVGFTVGAIVAGRTAPSLV